MTKYEIENCRVGYITKDGLYGNAEMLGSGVLTVCIPDDAEILPGYIVDSLHGQPPDISMSKVDMGLMQRAIDAKKKSAGIRFGTRIPRLKLKKTKE